MNANVQRWLNENFVPADNELIQDLDTMAYWYVRAILWSETRDAPEESGDEPLEDTFSPEDMTPKFWKRVRLDILRFIAADEPQVWRIDPEKAGIDLWLTRQKHGAGFWDSPWIKGNGAYGQYLTMITDATLPETYVYVGDDGELYFG